MDNTIIFAGTKSYELGKQVSEKLELELGEIKSTRFKDGEYYARIVSNVKGKHAIVIQSSSKYVNDSLMELAIIVDALKRSLAEKITIIMPYYGYARQDRRAKDGEPITAKLVARLLEAAGIHKIMSIDLHSDQIEGFFRVPVCHLTARKLFVEYFKKLALDNVCIVAPDAGSAKKARKFADNLGASLAIVDKHREKANEVSEMIVVGNVKGKNCIIIDDMIDTGGTIVKGAQTLIEQGAKKTWICATHGIFSGEALEKLSKSPTEKVIITNTIQQGLLPEKIKVLSAADLIANEIREWNGKK